MEDNTYKENSPEYHWNNWKKTPGKKTMSIAVKSLSREIDNFANSYSSTIDSGMAKSRARKYAIDAVRSYDPEYGASLKTHFFNYIKPMAREMKGVSEFIPLSKHYESGANSYVKFIDGFIGENGREPDDDEIMDGLSISKKQLGVINSTIKYEVPEAKLESYDLENPNDEFSNKLNLWTEYVRYSLPPVKKKILDLKIGANGNTPMNNREVAEKLGITEKEVADFSIDVSSRILKGANTKSKILHNNEQ